MEPFIGLIAAFGFNYNPRGWVFCNGQLLSIAQYSALFSLIGTTYGGDGISTFGVPDLRGRTLVGMGQGPGLPAIQQGEMAGSQSVTITTDTMPAHIHTLSNATLAVSNSNADGISAVGGFLANTASTTKIYAESHNAVSHAITGTTDMSGYGLPIQIQNPFLGINYCIATEGIYPSRN